MAESQASYVDYAAAYAQQSSSSSSGSAPSSSSSSQQSQQQVQQSSPQSSQAVEGVASMSQDQQQQQQQHHEQDLQQQQEDQQQQQAAEALYGAPNGVDLGVPSDDECKLFVGQIPPTCSADMLRATFAQFGEVTDLVILRDRATGNSKGCGFVTFSNRAAADLAIASLCYKVKLPDAKRELVVRHSTDRPEDKDAKIYVCMLSRQSTAEDVHQMFSPYGQIVEVHMLRSREVESNKGAAFVRFASREEAQNAINAVNDKVHDKDAPGPVQVRFAHSKSERNNHLSNVMRGGGGGGRGGYNGTQDYGHGGPGGRQNPLMPAYSSMGYAPHLGYGMNKYPNAYQNLYNAPQGYQPGPRQPIQSQQGAFQNMNQPAYNYDASNPQFGFGYSTLTPPQHPQLQPFPKDPRGPDGANVFIWNLPPTFTEGELSALFLPFGNIISVRVQRNPQTGTSRGFGFVSFEDPSAAAAAVQGMDSFAIGARRLSVRLKSNQPRRRGPQSFPLLAHHYAQFGLQPPQPQQQQQPPQQPQPQQPQPSQQSLHLQQPQQLQQQQQQQQNAARIPGGMPGVGMPNMIGMGVPSMLSVTAGMQNLSMGQGQPF